MEERNAGLALSLQRADKEIFMWLQDREFVQSDSTVCLLVQPQFQRSWEAVEIKTECNMQIT